MEMAYQLILMMTACRHAIGNAGGNVEAAFDTDGDGHANHLDQDTDGDGIPEQH